MGSLEFIAKIEELQQKCNGLSCQIENLRKNNKKKASEVLSDFEASQKSLPQQKANGVAQLEQQKQMKIDAWDNCIASLKQYESQISVDERGKCGFNLVSFSPVKPNFEVLDQYLSIIRNERAKIFKAKDFKDYVYKFLTYIGQGKEYSFQQKNAVVAAYDEKIKNFELSFDEKIDALTPQHKQDIEEITSDFQNKKNNVLNHYHKYIDDNGIKYLYSSMLEHNRSIGADDSYWENYIPAECYPNSILVGDIQLSLSLPNDINELIPDVSWNDFEKIKIPFSLDFTSPINLFIEYSDNNKERVYSGINAILMRIISEMPVKSFEITYIDPIEFGSNIGRLKAISELNGCPICKRPVASKTDIARQLKILESLVADYSLEFTDIDSIYQYNKMADSKLEYSILVLNDFPNGLEGAAIDSLENIINNANKCGISIIVTKRLNEKIEQNKLEILDKIKNGFHYIDATKNDFLFHVEEKEYAFALREESQIPDRYIESVLNAYSDASNIDNSFNRVFNIGDDFKYLDATSKLNIPFAIDRHNQLASLEIGGPLTAHSMLSGITGSGKSTTLHALIASILVNYHPDDVELWLVDYKRVEFAEYLINTPPHIKLLGLDRTEEFTLSLLDKLKHELFEYRSSLFKANHVLDIEGYNNLPGVKKIPRIVLVIDEFHNLTQAIQDNSDYIKDFENILSEGRSFGLSCILSDQSIRDGLRGMTEKGRKQVSNRLAMRNEDSDVRETLAIDNVYYTERLKDKIRTLGLGDVIFKKEYATRFGETKIVIDKYKSINVNKEDRKELLDFINQNVRNYQRKDLIVVDGKYRIDYSENDVFKTESSIQNLGIPFYLGTPASLEPCFHFSVTNKIDENITVIGNNSDMRFSISYYAIKSYLRNIKNEVIVLAHESDELYLQYKKYLYSNSHVKVVDSLSGICKTIFDLQESVRNKTINNTLLVVFGIDTIFAEMSHFKKKTAPSFSVKEEKNDPFAEMILKMDNALSAFDDLIETTESEPAEELFDVRDDFVELCELGSREGLHIMLDFESIKLMNRLRLAGIKLDSFKHKIALKMTEEDASKYTTNSRRIAKLDEITAIYNDGSGKSEIFRPYLLPNSNPEV